MSTPVVRRHADRDSLAAAVAAAVISRLEAAQSRGEVPQVGLTGGSVADAIHRELGRRAAQSGVNWKQVVFWWGDERWVPAGSDDRNELQARRAFLDEVGVDPANVHPMPASDSGLSLSEAALAYGATIREFGAGFFEILMLGIGPDGHIASLFPDHPDAAVTNEIAVAVHNSPKPPPERISFTFEAMARANAVWFVASGEDKADPVARTVSLTTDPAGDSPRTPTRAEVLQTPAAGVRGTQETVWWLDDAAASALP